ncbi:MAG TPA: nuclear transport factor 2 family protein [Ramlibacter sp.]|nr:nuclear transport factor 2 family protein [Ramlibacter sp.]
MTTRPPHVSTDLLQELRQLYEDYADTLDAQDLEGWPGYFTEGCRYQVISRENHEAGLPHATIHCDGLGMVKDRALATRECTVYEPRYLRHFMHGLRVSATEGDAIHARCGFMVVESVSDQEPRILVVGQYVDTIVRDGAGLRFRERLCVYDNFRIYNTLVFPV